MWSRSLPRPSEHRRGTVTPLTVLNLSLLVGVVALAIDGGTLMEARRHVQAAADAAALAGAADLYSNYSANQGLDLSGTAQASALAIASANGFLNDGVQSTVTVNTSPKTYQGGPHAGQTIPPGYIEVVIQYNADHLFSGVFGSGTTPVRARAVARGQTTQSNNSALLALNLSPNISGALAISGTASLNVNGAIQINSSSSQALNLTATGTVTATQLAVNPALGNLLGSITSLLSGLLGGTPPPVLTALPVADPLRYLPPPDPTKLNPSSLGANLTITGGTWDLYPGVYSGGIRVNTNSGPTTVILHANSDGTPGIYYLDGVNGLQVSGSASIKTAANETAGVMIYNNWSGSNDSINLKASGAVTIIPPASGPYKGLSIFQKRGTLSTPGPTLNINGQGNVNVTGTIYAAHTGVSLTAYSGTNAFGGQIIADTISVNGSATANINAGTQPTANMRVLGLVE
jgi:Flp pilus assembly protein TadG